jgi:hypothetical protein
MKGYGCVFFSLVSVFSWSKQKFSLVVPLQIQNTQLYFTLNIHLFPSFLLSLSHIAFPLVRVKLTYLNGRNETLTQTTQSERETIPIDGNGKIRK